MVRTSTVTSIPHVKENGAMLALSKLNSDDANGKDGGDFYNDGHCNFPSSL